MATQEDLQELLRMLTSRNVGMLIAMGQAKALQSHHLLSIRQIAEAPLSTISEALGNPKAAKSLHAACNRHLETESSTRVTGRKRPAVSQQTPGSHKKARFGCGGANVAEEPQSSRELEESLLLPVSATAEIIAPTHVYTNRAPLLIAFAVELLRVTMPEQPLSSRLSLAQAVVSRTSTAKARNLDLEIEPRRDASWADGQPRVTVMGCEVAVLKRGGYDRHGDQRKGESIPSSTRQVGSTDGLDSETPDKQSSVWAESQPFVSQGSTFVAHAIPLSNISEGRDAVHSLLGSHPTLKSATHNSWGLRVIDRMGQAAAQERQLRVSEDDGETGCGSFILHLLDKAGADNTLVVVSRWFGGVMLGPDRWRLIRSCVQEALSEQLRQPGWLSETQEIPLWGLDLKSMNKAPEIGIGGGSPSEHWDQPIPRTVIHRPELVRSYLLTSFLDGPEKIDSTASVGKRNELQYVHRRESNLEDNLALVMGALRLLFESWRDHLPARQLDSKAWFWYLAVRPEVEAGPAGWGAKGWLDLNQILALRHGEE